jgi:hypothetical protein
MPAFQLAVALRVVGTGSGMCQTIFATESLEVIGDELRAIVADNSRLDSRVLFNPFGYDQFDIQFLHGFT